MYVEHVPHRFALGTDTTIVPRDFCTIYSYNVYTNIIREQKLFN